MTDFNVATVKDVLGDSGGLIVTFNTQSTVIVDDRTSDTVSPGDLVRVDDQSLEAIELVQSEGYDSGNLVGVVKRTSEDRVIVQTENTHLGFPNPESLDLNEEDTVEIESTSGRILDKIEDVDPPSFDQQESEFDVDDYKTENLDDSFEDIGGLNNIKERVREVVELPLSKSEEFDEIGAEALTETAGRYDRESDLNLTETVQALCTYLETSGDVAGEKLPEWDTFKSTAADYDISV